MKKTDTIEWSLNFQLSGKIMYLGFFLESDTVTVDKKKITLRTILKSLPPELQSFIF